MEMVRMICMTLRPMMSRVKVKTASLMNKTAMRKAPKNLTSSQPTIKMVLSTNQKKSSIKRKSKSWRSNKRKSITKKWEE